MEQTQAGAQPESILVPATDRLDELLGHYGRGEVCLATELCDAHDAAAIAATVVAPDLTCQDLTFGELRERSERFAALLAARGIGPGDRVATLMGKSAELLVVLLGIWRRGATHVPLFTAFAPPAIDLRLRASSASAVVVDPDQRAKLAELGVDDLIIEAGDQLEALTGEHPPGIDPLPIAADSPFLMIFTSGTTGNPKGVPVSVRAIANMQAYLELALDVDDDDVYWNPSDPGWAYGLWFAVVAPLAAGKRTILLAAGFAPELTWRVLSDLEVTNFAAAPTIYRALRGAGEARPDSLSLRRLSSAGEPLDPATLQWARDALGVEIRDHYGQTEVGMVVGNAWRVDLAGPLKMGSMGRPLPGWEVVVLREDSYELAAENEPGRVAIDIPASPAMSFAGYHEAPEKTAERIVEGGRWYLTGDVASRDGDGYLFFASRDDDVIIMAGYRIGPFEVESVLSSHPAVAEAAAIGVPDPLRGEVIEAYVALVGGMPGSSELASELQQRVKTEYAAHAYPRTVHFVEALPRTPSGKVQRFILRDRRRAEIEAEGVGG